MIAKITERWVRAVVRRPVPVLAACALTVALSLLLAASRLELRTSNLDLVRPDLTEVRRFLDFAHEFGTPNVLVIVLESEDEGQLATSVRRLGPELRAVAGVRAVLDRLDYDTETLEDLDLDEFLMSFDHRQFFVLVQPEDARSEASTIAPLVAGVQAVLDGADLPELGVRAGLTGLPKYALDDRQVIEHDLARLSLLAFGLVLVLFVLSFRSVGHPAMAMVALLVGVCWTLGAAAVFPGHLTLLSAFFGSILFGLGVDFAIHAVTRVEELTASGRPTLDALPAAFGAVAPALTIAAATTAAAFYAMRLSGFRGFAELGTIAGTGVLLCLLATLIVLPACWSLATRIRPGHGARRATVRRRGAEHLGDWIRARPRTTTAVALVIGGLTLVAATLAWIDGGPTFDDDYLNLQPRDSEAVRLERLMVAGSDLSPQFAAFVVDSREDAAELTEQLLDEEGVGEVHSISDLDGLVDSDGRPLELPDAFRNSLQSASGRYAIYAYPEGDAWKPSVRDEFLRRMRSLDPNVTGMPFVGGFMVSRSKRALRITTITSLILILLCVGASFRSLRYSLLAATPSLMTLAAMPALMRWLGLELNPLNVIALPVVLGIAVDDGVHMVHSFLAEGGDLGRTVIGTGRAVVLTSLTSLAAFGAVSLTTHRGLASFALLVVLGVLLALILSILVLPGLLRLCAGLGFQESSSLPIERSRAAVSGRGLLLVLMAALLPALPPPPSFAVTATGPEGAHPRQLEDPAEDQIIERTLIPSERNVHGEVRLIRCGDAWVLQTVLFTRQLQRGVRRMTKKELYYWSDRRPGAEDSDRYLADLEAAKTMVMARSADHGSDSADGRERMMIELVLTPSASSYAFYDIDLEAVDSADDSRGVKVTRRERLLARDVSRQYLRSELLHQAETAFDRQLPQLQDLQALEAAR